MTQSDADEQLLIYIPFREVRPRPRLVARPLRVRASRSLSPVPRLTNLRRSAPATTERQGAEHHDQGSGRRCALAPALAAAVPSPCAPRSARLEPPVALFCALARSVVSSYLATLVACAGSGPASVKIFKNVPGGAMDFE